MSKQERLQNLRRAIMNRRLGAAKYYPVKEHNSKTFDQFIELVEKYYEPDQTLPGSKQTPLEKAQNKSKRRARTIATQSPANQERWGKQYDLTRTHVSHGADNPEYNDNVSFKDRNDLKVSADPAGTSLDVYHKPSGVSFYVYRNSSSAIDNPEDTHTIEWGHDKQDQKHTLSPREKYRIGRNAQRVWDQHVVHRIPQSKFASFAHNTPVSSYDERGREKPVNRRAELYKRAGFGEPDHEGDQFARIGRRMPSPKQRAKGKTRFTPVSAHLAKDIVNWDNQNGTQESDEWED